MGDRKVDESVGPIQIGADGVIIKIKEAISIRVPLRPRGLFVPFVKACFESSTGVCSGYRTEHIEVNSPEYAPHCDVVIVKRNRMLK